MSVAITEKQRNYAFALLKNHDLWQTRIEDLDDGIPCLDYYLERTPQMKTWDWLSGLDMDEAKELIEYLAEKK